MPYDLDKIRKQLREKMTNKPKDPFEFRPPKAKDQEVLKFRFYVLGPLMKGDKCTGGVASRDMPMFALKHGMHWINRQPYDCPRVNCDEECELCNVGFDLLKDTNDKERRKVIVKQWLANQSYTVNAYFPNIESNIEEVRGKVLYFNAPKTCFDNWYAAITRDSGGDETDPEAYGVFYDEYGAFLYQLEVTNSGDWNSYKTSKFLANLGRHPIARTKDGKPDKDRIKAIMDQRHDLWQKIGTPDPAKIHRLCQQMLGTDDEEEEQEQQEGDEGTTVAEGRPPAQTGRAIKEAPKPKPGQEKPAKKTAAEALEDELPGLAGDNDSRNDEKDDAGSDASAEDVEPEPEPEPKAKPKAKAKKPVEKPAEKPAAKTKPTKVPEQQVAADDDDENIDALLAKLTPGGVGRGGQE